MTAYSNILSHTSSSSFQKNRIMAVEAFRRNPAGNLDVLSALSYFNKAILLHGGLQVGNSLKLPNSTVEILRPKENQLVVIVNGVKMEINHSTLVQNGVQVTSKGGDCLPTLQFSFPDNVGLDYIIFPSFEPSQKPDPRRNVVKHVEQKTAGTEVEPTVDSAKQFSKHVILLLAQATFQLARNTGSTGIPKSALPKTPNYIK